MHGISLLRTARVVGDEVEVTWNDAEAPVRFGAFWLRDHCHAEHSLHPETLQRQVDTFTIPADLAVARVEIVDAGRSLSIHWREEGRPSRLPAAFLRRIATNEGREPAPRRRLWDRAAIGELFPSVAHADIMAGDAGLLRWLELVEEYGFALATGVPATIEATKQMVTRIGYVRETIFGGMWDFTANMAFKDSAYTSAAIGPHTDGTYSIDSPGFQLFHCLKFEGAGGASTLVDGFKVASAIRDRDTAAFAALSSVKVPSHYLGDGVHLSAEHSIIELDHNGDFVQIAYNNYDRAPFRLPAPRMKEFYRALTIFNHSINDPANEITMRLAPGTALLFDNWRTLHGRRAYQGHRWLCGAYLNKEDFDSRLRVLRTAVAAPSAAPRVLVES